jgi:hypothetical protein
MKIKTHNPKKCRQGVLMIDLAMAMIVLSMAILPLAFSFAQEREVLRLDYFRSVADEVVDGEMEVLAAGAWKNFVDGAQPYAVHAQAAANLPAGHFELTKTGNHLRLEWIPDRRRGIGVVTREITIK